jgi:2-oxoglutarate dehydrogenase E2 component (dihydrolipoamide succinyltransferase)
MFSRQFPRFRRCCETSTRQKHYFSILGRSTSAQFCLQPAKSEQPQLGQLAIPYVRWFHASAALRSDVVEVEGPAFAESISEGDIRWVKQKGDFVNADELVAEIETDKTSVEVPAPFSGTIVELLVPDGEKVVAKQKLYKLQKGEGGGSSESSSKPEKVEKEEKEEKPEPKEDDKPAPKKEDKPAPPRPSQQSHSAPQKQPENKPKPVENEKSGPIPKNLPQVPQPPSKPLSSKPVEDIPLSVPGLRAPSDGKNPITGDRTETRVKMNRMRQRIAQRLKEAQNTNAMLTTFNEVDMTNIMSLRKKYQDAFVKKYGIKFGLMSPFVRAAALALQDQPVVNAVIEDEEIVYRNYVDISVAVASPKGLLVPVLRNVESQGYASIEKTLAALGAKARDGKIAIEDMQGGTFTISNGGVFGSLFGTPIINPPQSAILGMHSIVERPVAVNGEVKIRPMMYVALTYDHRLIDGREAVLFLRKIKEGVEDPATILLDL